ncbi:hypothetical protein RHGRI_019312 [Rhododendron griersonianum]|uniref:K Homology domain-containing protein n=1 Tax=Rhododendron griersonianum TaxID=479676 RepID=A0AAV6JGD7_9ERIC|nr:hypothetical protein RHGRI_019312 [Rhododendron griersonianum]
MAEPHETPTDPAPPPAAEGNPNKRPREDDGGDDETPWGEAPSPKRRIKSAADVLYRIVVPSRQIGKRHEERVIIISSKDSDNTISDAEKALYLIASLILKDDEGNLEALKVGAGHVASNTIRLLIAGSQAGGMIGTSGQNIVNLRNSSGATITVLAQNQIPLYASAHESDRVVQISGDVSAVMKALEEIGSQLRDNPPKQAIALIPTSNRGLNRTPQHYVDPTSADYMTLEMLVSETMVGGLIGRCGSNISKIRTESGAAIKVKRSFTLAQVHGGKGEHNHRQIHIGGSAQQVALAKQRIDEYVYSQFIQQVGAQQLIDPASGLMNTALAPFFPSTTPANQVPAYPPCLPYYAPPM